MRLQVVWFVQLLRQKLGHASRDVTFARRNNANGVHDIGGLAGLVEVATGALTYQIHRVMLLGVATQYENAHIRRFGTDHRQGIHTGLARHGQVHHQHIQLGGSYQVNRFATTGGFTHHAQVDKVGKKLFQPRAHNGVVVHDTNFDHVVVFL